MAKSTGNLVLVADLLERRPARRSASSCSTATGAGRGTGTPPASTAPPPPSTASTRQRPARAGSACPSATAEVLRVLAGDLDVPAAIELAVGEGGEAARLLISVLGLGDATSSG